VRFEIVLVALICGENEVNNNRHIKRMQLIGRSILSMNEQQTIIMACVVGVRKLRRKGFVCFCSFFASDVFLFNALHNNNNLGSWNFWEL
jgi:hypothetical protein